jgi:hypothetical protein
VARTNKVGYVDNLADFLFSGAVAELKTRDKRNLQFRLTLHRHKVLWSLNICFVGTTDHGVSNFVKLVNVSIFLRSPLLW